MHRRFLAGAPRLVGMGLAGEVIPGMRKDLLLHAGPPITWMRMCGPLRGAVLGAGAAGLAAVFLALGSVLASPGAGGLWSEGRDGIIRRAQSAPSRGVSIIKSKA